MSKEKVARGGARPGAGRPPISPEQLKSVAVSVRLQPDTHAQLTAAAARQNMSITAVIRQLIEKYLEKNSGSAD